MKQTNIRFKLNVATTSKEVGGFKTREIPPGTYSMTLISFDGCVWLAHNVNDAWFGKTLGDWATFIEANTEGSTLTMNQVRELLATKAISLEKLTRPT